MINPKSTLIFGIAALFAAPSAFADGSHGGSRDKDRLSVQLGPRPYYLVNDMEDGPHGGRHRAQQMIDEYKEAGVHPGKVWAQSFNLGDVLFWLRHEPRFGKESVYLDDRVDAPGGYDVAVAGMSALRSQGVNIVAPPMWALLTTDASGKVVPSDYARAAKRAGLGIITWTLERSGLPKDGGGYYYKPVAPAIDNDGDALVALDVLARKVGVLGVFSDWPATTSLYGDCMGLE